MPKRATMIILGEKEQEALEQLTRRHRSEQQAQRAHIILAAAQGSSDAQIGRELALDVDTVPQNGPSAGSARSAWMS